MNLPPPKTISGRLLFNFDDPTPNIIYHRCIFYGQYFRPDQNSHCQFHHCSIDVAEPFALILAPVKATKQSHIDHTSCARCHKQLPYDHDAWLPAVGPLCPDCWTEEDALAWFDWWENGE